jgi:glycosyltransferase involved in cell wall biosynthesis
MRILHILNDVTDRGNGIVNTAIDLAIEQVRHGHVVAVASAGGGYEPLLERAGVVHLTLNQSRRPGRMLIALTLLGRYLRGFQPDVVHAHMRTGLLLAWIWRRFQKFVLVGHVHNVHDRESVIMGMADRVIAVSHSVAGTMARSGISASKIRVVLNRTLGSRRRVSLDEVRPATLERPAIITVGGLNSRKGIEELILAFERVGGQFREAHLYLVGDGPERERFERQAAGSNWHDRIHFEGFQGSPQAYMLSADVFVLASRRESFGLVLIEAREAGCAIIAADVDGVAEALENGQAGVLVRPRDIERLATAISEMIADDKEREKWKLRGQEGIERYRVHEMASEVQAVYDEVIDANGWRRSANLSLGAKTDPASAAKS